MSQDRTVLEHLLEGRSALVAEVERLTAAIDELDAVIGRIGVASRVTGAGPDTADSVARRAATRAEPVTAAGETVNAADPSAGAKARRSRTRGPARKAASRKRAAAGTGADGQKSIRVHVLEMLAADDRDFGLAEIIDRVHGAGIQAHDDAVRSITIKLMKDGKVERVGRGQYRLARRGEAAERGSSSPAATAPSVTTGQPTPSTAETTASLSYTPPLNLAQPWETPQA